LFTFPKRKEIAISETAISVAKVRKVEHKTKKFVSFFVETEYLRHLDGKDRKNS
jgi:hypothetical protein